MLVAEGFAGEVDKYVFQCGGGNFGVGHEAFGQQLLDELIGRVEGDDLSIVHDGHAVAEEGGFLHVVGGEDHDGAPGFDLGDQFPQVSARLWIETGGALVEKDHHGFVHQGGGN